jgi:hypothetical protein
MWIAKHEDNIAPWVSRHVPFGSSPDSFAAAGVIDDGECKALVDMFEGQLVDPNLGMILSERLPRDLAEPAQYASMGTCSAARNAVEGALVSRVLSNMLNAARKHFNKPNLVLETHLISMRTDLLGMENWRQGYGLHTDSCARNPVNATCKRSFEFGGPWRTFTSVLFLNTAQEVAHLAGGNLHAVGRLQ